MNKYSIKYKKDGELCQQYFDTSRELTKILNQLHGILVEQPTEGMPKSMYEKLYNHNFYPDGKPSMPFIKTKN